MLFIHEMSETQLKTEFIDFMDIILTNDRNYANKIYNKTILFNDFIKMALKALKYDMTGDCYFHNLYKHMKKVFKVDNFTALCILLKDDIQKEFKKCYDCTII